VQSVLTAIDASDGNACLNAKVRTRSQTSFICVSLDLVRTFVISPKLTALAPLRWSDRRVQDQAINYAQNPRELSLW
jgi:hypothetical protein